MQNKMLGRVSAAFAPKPIKRNADGSSSARRMVSVFITISSCRISVTLRHPLEEPLSSSLAHSTISVQLTSGAILIMTGPMVAVHFHASSTLVLILRQAQPCVLGEDTAASMNGSLSTGAIGFLAIFRRPIFRSCSHERSSIYSRCRQVGARHEAKFKRTPHSD